MVALAGKHGNEECLPNLYEQMCSFSWLLVEGRAECVIYSMEHIHVLFLDQGVKSQQNKASKRLALLFLWMEVSILMWNKTGIQNDTPLKPEVTGSWSSGEVCAWEGGIREWLYLRLHQTSQSSVSVQSMLSCGSFKQ